MSATKNNSINVILNPGTSYSYDCVEEFKKAASSEGLNILYPKRKYKMLARLLWFVTKYISLPPLKLGDREGTPNLFFNIGPDFEAALEFSPYNDNNFMFAYDCWPRFMDQIIKLSHTCRVKVLFFSSRQARDLFNDNREGRTRCIGVWIPEGIDAEEYFSQPFMEKDIDVLEFGRRYEKIHSAIREPLKVHGYHHAYAKDGNILFNTKEDFTKGLARAKISLCFPSDITHPERAEFISTTTLRYFQCMASKCLIVGKTPSDMVEIFGYNPVVEINMDNAAVEILDILRNYGKYKEIIERNYREVHSRHTWKERLKEMLVYIANSQ